MPDADKALVKGLKEGEESAWREIVNKYKKKALYIAYDITGNIEDAEDISQEAFIKVYYYIKKFRGDSSFWTWFYRILINLCLQRQKKSYILYRFVTKKKEPAEDRSIPEDALLGDINWANSPGRLVLKDELKNELNRAIDSLAGRERTAFVLYSFHDLSIADVSAIMNCKEGTIKSTLFRAVRKLRKKLRQYIK